MPYPGRTPHIHFKIKRKGRKELLTTQCYIKGEPANNKDGIFRASATPRPATRCSVDFAPIKESRIGELAAKFDVVLGFTPGRETRADQGRDRQIEEMRGRHGPGGPGGPGFGRGRPISSCRPMRRRRTMVAVPAATRGRTASSRFPLPSEGEGRACRELVERGRRGADA